MRNSLPNKIRPVECGIINLDNKNGHGTHWTAYQKYRDRIVYYDSYGNLKPPLEVVNYLRSGGNCKIFYNKDQEQSYGTVYCGHLCLRFLTNIWK